LDELNAAIRYQVTTLQNDLNQQLDEIRQTISNYSAGLAARDVIDKKEIRSQLAARSNAAFAAINVVQTVAVDTQTAFASYQTTVTAQFGAVNASVSTNSSAIATLNGYAAASYSVSLNVNGYATGFELLNGGSGFSSFTVVSDKFQIQLPGYNGSAPLPVFTVGTLNGVAAIGISGNLYLDGTLNARAIVAGTVDATRIVAGTIDATRMTAGTITSASGVIGALSVQSLSIGDNAVTVPVAQSLGSNVSGNGSSVTYFSFNLSVDTTGLAGKTIPIYASLSGQWNNGATGSQTSSFNLIMNGSVVNGYFATTSAGTLALVILSGAINVTGTGGVMSINIAATFSGSSLTYIGAGATIFAMATKR
jgi:hypothetical protein